MLTINVEYMSDRNIWNVYLEISRLEPPSGIIQSVTELIPESYTTNRESKNENKDSNPECSSQRNVTEDDREDKKVLFSILWFFEMLYG